MSCYSIGVIGAGKLAKSLLMSPAAGYSYSWVLSKSASGIAAIEQIASDNKDNNLRVISSIEESDLPDILFVAVNDGAIAEVSAGIASHYRDSMGGRHVVHFSGINHRDILKACSDCGAHIHKAHPYQTFYYPDKGVFNGIYWGVEFGSNSSIINEFIAALEGNIIDLSSKGIEEHIKYHASAVAASNFFNTLLANSRDLLDDIGVENRIVIPIIKQTLKNAFRGNEFPLTGPIARGDADTVKKHIETLRGNKSSITFYAMMSHLTARLCRDREIISEEKYLEICRLLKPYISDTD